MIQPFRYRLSYQSHQYWQLSYRRSIRRWSDHQAHNFAYQRSNKFINELVTSPGNCYERTVHSLWHKHLRVICKPRRRYCSWPFCIRIRGRATAAASSVKTEKCPFSRFWPALPLKLHQRQFFLCVKAQESTYDLSEMSLKGYSIYNTHYETFSLIRVSTTASYNQWCLVNHGSRWKVSPRDFQNWFQRYNTRVFH